MSRHPSKPTWDIGNNGPPIPALRPDHPTDQAGSPTSPHLLAHRERCATHQRTTGHRGSIWTTWHRPHHRGCRRRRHHPSQKTMVVVSKVGQSQNTVGGQHPVGSSLDANRHTVAPPSQPHRTNITTNARHQAPHSTRRTAERRPVPLPDHTSPRRERQTGAPTYQRETRHDSEMAGRPPSFCTVAVPKEVPCDRCRRTSTPRTSPDERTDDGFRWTTHGQHDTG